MHTRIWEMRLHLMGKTSRIKSVRAEMKDGILQMQYGLLAEVHLRETEAVFPALQSRRQPIHRHPEDSTMKGRVEEVQGDKVKVFLTSVDQEYDSGGNWWFPYSTTYSSSDGSGMELYAGAGG